jgi:hypothetical protein
VISQATNGLQSWPGDVKSMFFLLSLDSNIPRKKFQSLETDRTVICQPPIPLVPWLFEGGKAAGM